MTSKVALCLLAALGLSTQMSPAQDSTPAPEWAPTAPSQPFEHPGIFSSQAELDTITRRLATQDPHDPMTAGWKSVMDSKFNNLQYQPKPVVIVTRENKSPSPVDERDAAMVSYVMALRWVLSGDQPARDKSLATMKAWADVFEDHKGDVNTYLDSAWVLTVWSAAGELMRHGRYQGRAAEWPAADLEKFSTMLRRLEAHASQIILLPQWKGHTGNWDSSAMLAEMATGIFLDDRAMYNRGRDTLLEFMPKMLHKEGWPTEVFRDPWHCGITLSAIIEAAEVARHQGNDTSLYEAKYEDRNEPRILECMKWSANPLRGIPTGPLPTFKIGPAYLHKKAGWYYNAKDNVRNTGAYEMALNYYTRIAPRPGLEGFKDMTLKFYRPSGQDHSIYLTSDTLTHGDLSPLARTASER